MWPFGIYKIKNSVLIVFACDGCCCSPRQ